MSRQRASSVIAGLIRFYPREEMSPERLEMMLSDLADIPDDALEEAAAEHRRSSPFFPSVSELRTAAVERALALPSEHEALAQVEALARWARLGESERGERPPMDGAVKDALALVGGLYSFRTTEKPSIVRGQFLSYYRGARSGLVRDVVVGRTALSAARLALVPGPAGGIRPPG